MAKKVISSKNISSKLPLLSITVTYLLLQHLDAGELWYGIFGTIYVLITIAAIVGWFKEEDIDIFSPNLDAGLYSTFAKKLKSAMIKSKEDKSKKDE